MAIKQTPGMGFVGLIPDEEPFMRTDGSSFTYPYPSADGSIIFHTFRIGKTLNSTTGKPMHFFLMAASTKLDPREDNFEPSVGDSTTAIPITESALYGLMQLLTSLRADMIPETSAMLTTVFESGHFQRN